MILFVLAAGLASGAAIAGAIDGKWIAEITVRGGKKTGSQERKVEARFNLKRDGDKATGSVTSGAKKRNVTAQIVAGKINGNRFSFTTVQTSKKGEQRLVWEGTMEGETLHGTRSREGAKRGQDFTAKRE